MKKTEKHLTVSCVCSILMFIIVNTSTAQENNIVKDQDGNNYKTVKIGNQTWMAENLKTTKYNDGTAIPLVTDSTVWVAMSSPAYCLYNNDKNYKNIYGALYNGYTINTGKLCPTGWHVATDAEWSTLVSYLGGENVAGGKLKENGTDHWNTPNLGATNESGFAALPGGSRYTNGLFFTIKNIGYWWSPTETKSLNGWYRSMNNKTSNVSRNFIDSTNGFSVRCVMN